MGSVARRTGAALKRGAALAAGAAAFLANRLLDAGAQTAAPLRIGYSLNDSGLAPAYAADQGFFTKAGLNVELTPFTTPNGGVQAMLAGAIDLGVVDCISVANAFLHGFPIAAFAGGCAFAKTSPTLVMVTQKSSAIRGPKDLEGQTVAVPALKSLSASMAAEWIRVNGADPAKVKWLELTFPEMNSDLERGTIAAALQGEPFLSNAKASQRALGVPFEAMGKPFYINVYAASHDWLTNNVPLARKLAAAFYDTARWTNTHRPESATIESRLTKIPLDIAQTMARNVFATSFDPTLMQPELDIANRYQLLPRAVKAQELAFTL